MFTFEIQSASSNINEWRSHFVALFFFTWEKNPYGSKIPQKIYRQTKKNELSGESIVWKTQNRLYMNIYKLQYIIIFKCVLKLTLTCNGRDEIIKYEKTIHYRDIDDQIHAHTHTI